MVVYADDFIVSGNSKELLETKVKPTIEEFLKERGLTLSGKKTIITNIDTGFDFLGFNIRKYKDKLLIKPSKKSVKTFLSKIRQTIKSRPTVKTENLIFILNPKIRGWANYFRHVVSKERFNYVDFKIHHAIWNWAKRRHPTQGKRWIWRKYFPIPDRCGILAVKIKGKSGIDTITIARASQVIIRRHVKIRSDANPFDPRYRSYFESRDSRRKSLITEETLPTF